ncbi:acyltransferase family protein [Fibrella arboris]|uniref:acyltransferase family protein n=1 Tax=Fibrella arboris TaxID=3242486 RepID=UPI0035220D8A
MLTTTSPQITQTLPAQSDRFHALDAVRAFALIIGVFFHGTMSFVSYIGYYWAIRDSQPSRFLDGFFYMAHSFRMQAFFLIAGYFAHLLYHRRGATSFLIHRTRRILVPLLLFVPIMYVLLGVLWTWGYQRAGLIPKESPVASMSPWLVMYRDVISLKWIRADLPIAHLWFLYYLMLFCVAAFVVRPLVNSVDKSGQLRLVLDRLLAAATQKWWGGLVLGVLLIGPTLTVTSWVGVDTPDHGFTPLLAPFSVYGLYFTVGWLFQRQPALIVALKRHWKLNLLFSLVVAGGLTAFLLTTIYAHNAPPTAPAIDPAVVNTFLPVINALSAVATMTAVFAFIGLILRYFSHPSKRIRYLSDSAYWLYIAHLPVVVLFQILVAPLQIHWLLKLPLIFVPSFALLFLTYHYGVRNTWLGTLLNGRRYPINQS